MKGWPPKDWRAILALVFSVLGAVVLTGVVWWAIDKLLPGHGWSEKTEGHRAQTIRWVLWLSSATIGAVLIGLGMAINRRSFSGNIGGSGFNFAGGEGEDASIAAARRVEEAASHEREQIEEEAAEAIDPASPPDTFPLPPADDDRRI